MRRQSTKRERVLQALSEAEGPMSANELWDVLRAESTGIGIATVYRALQGGVEEGRLVSVELQSGSVRYESADLAHHHHFLCSTCQRAFDLTGCAKDVARLAPPGFQVTNHEIVLYGECKDCRESA